MCTSRSDNNELLWLSLVVVVQRERERERRREKSLCVHHARQYHVFVAVCVYCLSMLSLTSVVLFIDVTLLSNEDFFNTNFY